MGIKMIDARLVLKSPVATRKHSLQQYTPGQMTQGSLSVWIHAAGAKFSNLIIRVSRNSETIESYTGHTSVSSSEIQLNITPRMRIKREF